MDAYLLLGFVLRWCYKGKRRRLAPSLPATWNLNFKHRLNKNLLVSIAASVILIILTPVLCGHDSVLKDDCNSRLNIY